jgi:nucleotide-binding universal stress UspA family protein
MNAEGTGDAVTIVVGFTPQPTGSAVVAAALEEARLRNASLLLVNVSRGDTYVDPNLAGPADLGAIEQLLRESDVEHEIRQYVGQGEPAERVVETARDAGAALVVIGLRRRTPVGKFLLGSTAQRILLDAPCPVLAVKVA